MLAKDLSLELPQPAWATARRSATSTANFASAAPSALGAVGRARGAQFERCRCGQRRTRRPFGAGVPVPVNYSRQGMGLSGGGHFSPVADYHPETDSFLLLDTAQYKYPSVWVPAADLHRAMATVDATAKRDRGYILFTFTHATRG